MAVTTQAVGSVSDYPYSILESNHDPQLIVASPTDGDTTYENTLWCNRDLIPMPPERRTFGIWGYCGQSN